MSSGVKKQQVKIVNSSLMSDDCPRLSVRPGSTTFSGFKFKRDGRRMLRKPNMIDNQMNKGKSGKKITTSDHHQLSSSSSSSSNLRSSNSQRRRLWLSGFFKVQLQMINSLKKKGKLSSPKISVVDNQTFLISSSSSSSTSCSLKNKKKKKKKITGGNCHQLSSSSSSYPMTLFDNNNNNNNSPILKKHRKKKIPENHHRIHILPKELLAEILKRLPVKYILRCRCVQKSWYSLLQSPMFITLHLNYQKKMKNIITNSHHHHHHHSKYLFFQHQFAVKLTLRFDDVQCQEYCKIEFPPALPIHAWFAVSYGLVCVSSTLRVDCDYNRNIYLWNPLIQKYKIIPDSPLPSKQDWKEWEALAFGFVPEFNDYVVVHIIKPNLHPNSHSVIIGVYSLNTNSWKKLSRDNIFISRLFSHINDVVFINGAAYWVGATLGEQNILMCFDTKTDILSEISLPDWLPPKNLPIIFPFGQSIAYFVWEHRVNHFDLWVLKDDLINGFIWEKKMCVSTSEDVREEVLGVRNNGEPILAKFNNLITYNLDSHEENDFVDSWDCWTPESPYKEGVAPRYVISPFVESLVLFDIDCNC